jgi:hypothetical protein
VRPGSSAVCTVRAQKGTVISSSNFEIDSADADAGLVRELLKHVELTEEVNGDSATQEGKAFVFTVKAKDGTSGRLVLDFPVSYR